MDRKRVSLELGATAPIAIADQCTNRLRHLKLHWNLHTAKIKLKQICSRLLLCLSKFDRSVAVNLETTSNIFLVFMPLAFCSRNHWSLLNYHLMATI